MFVRMILLVAISGMLVGCVHPKIKYRKARLLDPMMDPAKTAGLQNGVLGEPRMWYENGSGDSGSALGGSCPTCKG